MPRLQDLLFILLGIAVVVLLAYHLHIAVFALVGAFFCGCIYLFAGMVPPRDEAFWRRLFTTVFLACVLSCLVLIVPGTFGARARAMIGPVVTIAALLPLAAVGFEIARTPNVMQNILRSFRGR
jgi:hypothetical protein